MEHDFIIESKAHVYLSSIWNWRNDLDSARYHAQRSVDAALRSGDENIISNAYNMLGNAFESLGQLDSAFVSYETSLRHGELSGQPKNTSRALLNLGMIHRTRGEYASALERLTQAKVLCLKYNLKPYRANLYLSIGEVYLQIGDHAAAFENLQTALRSAKANRFPRVAARALMALGDIAWSTQDSAEAICWYTASRDAAREAEIPSIEGQASALMSLKLQEKPPRPPCTSQKGTTTPSRSAGHAMPWGSWTCTRRAMHQHSGGVRRLMGSRRRRARRVPSSMPVIASGAVPSRVATGRQRFITTASTSSCKTAS
jgi:tetratricopeptide (TPR) repeat protein